MRSCERLVVCEKICCWRLVFFLYCSILLPIPVLAQTTPVVIEFDFTLPPDADPTGEGQEAAERVFEAVVLPAEVLPRATTEAISQQQKEGRLLPNVLFARVSYESFSNSAVDKDGDIYGVSGSYERRMGAARAGALLNYRLYDMKRQGRDESSNRIAGVLYGTYGIVKKPLEFSAGVNVQGGYTVNDSDIADYATYGAGAYGSLGKDFEVLRLAVGASYLYSKYDVDGGEDQAHLVKYGVVLGAPIGRRFAVDAYFSETRNVTDYELDLKDANYFTVGAELMFSVVGSWVISGGYRTILDLEDFTSHRGYLGTETKF